MEQLCAIHLSGSELFGVPIHAHADEPQTDLLVVPLRDRLALPAIIIVVRNWIVIQRLMGDQRSEKEKGNCN